MRSGLSQMKFCRGQEGGGHISCLVSLCYLEAYALAPGQRLGAHPGLQREQGARLSLCTLDVGLQTRTSPELGGHVLPLWCQARPCLNLSKEDPLLPFLTLSTLLFELPIQQSGAPSYPFVIFFLSSDTDLFCLFVFCQSLEVQGGEMCVCR